MTILLAKYLTPEDFGTFAILIILALLAETVQHAAILSPMSTMGPMQRGEEAELYYGTANILNCIAGLVTTSVLLVATWAVTTILLDWRINEYLIPLGIYTLLIQQHEFFRRYFVVVNCQSVAVMIDIIRSGGQLLVVFGITSYSVEYAKPNTILYVLSLVLVGSVSVAMLRARNILKSRTSLQKVGNAHWKQSKWLLLDSTVQWVSGYALFFIIGGILGPVAVGVLRATQTLVGFMQIVMQAFERILHVQAATVLYNKGQKEFWRFIKVSIMMGATISLLHFALISVMSDTLLTLVYEASYGDYQHILIIWSVVMIPNILIVVSQVCFRVIERSRDLFRISFGSAILSVLFSFVLVQYYGLLGGIVGLLSGRILQALWLFKSMYIGRSM